jgi:hypothetical protein
VVTAFAVSPLGGAAVLTVIAFALGETQTSIGGTPVATAVRAYAYVKIAFVFFVMNSIVWYLVSIIFGVPGYLLLRSRGWVRGGHRVLLFAVIGSVAAVVFLFPLWILGGTVDVHSPIAVIRTFVGLTIVGLLAGTATGLIFAWITKVEAPSVDEVASTFE